jgi:hypothetical protein
MASDIHTQLPVTVLAEGGVTRDTSGPRPPDGDGGYLLIVSLLYDSLA